MWTIRGILIPRARRIHRARPRLQVPFSRTRNRLRDAPRLPWSLGTATLVGSQEFRVERSADDCFLSLTRDSTRKGVSGRNALRMLRTGCVDVIPRFPPVARDNAPRRVVGDTPSVCAAASVSKRCSRPAGSARTAKTIQVSVKGICRQLWKLRTQRPQRGEKTPTMRGSRWIARRVWFLRRQRG